MIRKNKIIYVISSFIHGRGGHLTCLKTLIDNLDKNKTEPIVVVVGCGERPEMFDDLKCQKNYFLIKDINDFEKIINNLEILVKREKPDIIHSFDNPSLFFSIHLSRLYKIPFIHTKPGGANPRGFFPKLPDLIVYSKENQEYFIKHPKFRNTEIFYMQARVSNIISDPDRIKNLKDKVSFNSGPIFLRINRIHPVYEESMMQGIRLIKKLNQDGIPANLIILGAKENNNFYKKIKSYEDKHIKVIIKEEYTRDADSIINIANFVIGVGNSLMAAAAFSRVILTTVKGASYPVLVTRDNFHQLFRYNFSPRSILNFDENKNYIAIKNLITNNQKQKKYKLFSYNLFKEYFDIKPHISEYEKIYNNLKYQSITPLKDYCLRLKYTLKAFNNVLQKISKYKLTLINFKIVFKLFLRHLRNL